MPVEPSWCAGNASGAGLAARYRAERLTVRDGAVLDIAVLDIASHTAPNPDSVIARAAAAIRAVRQPPR